AEEDKKRREAVDARNHAESLVHATEKTLKEHGEKVSGDDRKAIEDAVADLKKALENKDASTDDIKAKSDALTEASMKLGEALYKAQQQAEGNADANAQGGDENVVDADFEEVKDSDKGGDKKASA